MASTPAALAMKTVGDANTAGLVAYNTTLAPRVAGVIVFASRTFVVQPGGLDVGGLRNGTLAGLVTIAAGAAQ